jgi:arylsulfatase
MIFSRRTAGWLVVPAALGLLLPDSAHAQAAGPAQLDRTVLPVPERARPVYTEVNARNVAVPPRFEVKAPAGAPNVVIVLIDDLGFGVPAAFGGPVSMPTLDGLAQGGLRYTNFHTTALCSPNRAALKSGRNHHTVNMGYITELATGFPGATGQIPNATAPLAEMLRLNGYSTAAFGKWHETAAWEASIAGPFDRWPTRQGFDKFYGFLGGETNQWAPFLYDGTAVVELPNDPNYHLMADMTDQAVAWIKYQKALTPQKPAFVYFAPGATHAPHHVPKEWIACWKGRFDQGWDKLREETLARQIRMDVVPPGTKLAPKPPAIRDWDALSPDEKRLFTRQAEVFAAFAEYTDHEIGRMLKAFDNVGPGDNTLVFYIAGDNGTSGEGGQNGMFNEYTYFNGVQETVPDMLTMIEQWGGPETYPHMASGWTVALNAPFRLDKAGALGFRRHAQRHGRALAEGHQGEERHPHPVQPRHRRRADHPRGHRPAGAQGGQRHPAGPDGGHEPRVLLRECRREGAAHHAVLRDRRQPRDLPRRLVWAHDPQGTLGSQAAPDA